MFIFLRKDSTLYPLQGMRVRSGLGVWRGQRRPKTACIRCWQKSTQENLRKVHLTLAWGLLDFLPHLAVAEVRGM